MNRFKRILCVMEPDNPSKQTLERAVLLARNNQASLTVVAAVFSGQAIVGTGSSGVDTLFLLGGSSCCITRLVP